MGKQDDFIRTALRVPPGLHAKVHKAAEQSGRTFNAELVSRLEESFGEKTVMSELTEKLEALQEAFEALAKELGKGKGKK